MASIAAIILAYFAVVLAFNAGWLDTQHPSTDEPLTTTFLDTLDDITPTMGH